MGENAVIFGGMDFFDVAWETTTAEDVKAFIYCI